MASLLNKYPRVDTPTETADSLEVPNKICPHIKDNISATMAAANKGEMIYNGLKCELFKKLGIDLNDMKVESSLPTILNTEEYTQSILMPLVGSFQNFFDTASSFLGFKQAIKISDLSANTPAKKYIIEGISRGDPTMLIKDFESYLAKILNLCLGPYYPELFYDLEEFSVKFHNFLSPSDRIYEGLVSYDSDYEGLSQENSTNNSYPKLPGDLKDILVKMGQNDTSILHSFEESDIDRTLKILTLISILIPYLYSSKSIDKNKKNKDIAVLSVFFYLLEIILEDKDKKVNSKVMETIFGIKVSSNLYGKFIKSKLYKNFISKKELNPATQRFLARIAMSNPKLFINEDTFPYEKSILLLVNIKDKKRQDGLVKFISKINNSSWEDEDIALIIFLRLENLNYVYSLTPDDITYLYRAFCKEEDNTINVNRDTSLLHSMDYQDFLLMKSMETNPHGGDVLTFLLSSHENGERTISYMYTAHTLKKEMEYIPDCFTSLHEKASSVLDLKGKPYERNSEEIDNIISDIHKDSIFIELQKLHKELFSHFPQEESIKILQYLNNIYQAISRGIADTSTKCFIMGFRYITLEQFQIFSGFTEGQNLSQFDISSFKEGEIGEFIDYMIEYNCGDDILTAHELFIEDNSDINEDTGLDLNQQFKSIFGDDLGFDIIKIGFPDSIRWKIVEVTGYLEQWMIQLLGDFLINNKYALHEKLKQEPERFPRKFDQLINITIMMSNLGIVGIKKPSKLYEHILLGNNTRSSINYIVQFFDNNDIDASHYYDDTIKVIIQFLRDRKTSVLKGYLKKEREEEEEEEKRSINGKAIRAKTKGKNARVLLNGKNTSMGATDYWELHCQITESTFFSDSKYLSLSQNILNNTQKYDKEIYANIIISWDLLEGDYKKDILDQALVQLRSSPGSLSLNTMISLFQNIYIGSYSQQQIGNILDVCKDIFGKNSFQLEQSHASRFIYSLSFLSRYCQSSDILRLFLSNNNIISLTFNTSKSIHHALYGLFEYKELDFVKKLIKKLFASARKINTDRDEGNKGFMQIFHLYKINPPSKIKDGFNKAKEKDSSPNKWEEYVAKEFRKYFSKVLTGEYIDGFESDIIIVEECVNIEFDGIDYHQGWDSYKNERRDLHLRGRPTSYMVYRIRSDENIIQRVKEIVDQIQENNT